MASTTRIQLRRGLGFILALLMLVQLNLAPAFALSGFEVVSGDVTLSQTGNTYNITSNSAQAIVQWQTFNVNSNQTVNFLLPTTSSSIFNRVLNGQSNIMGNLNSNGIVLLSNTGGINIGATANINTGGFVASTLDMTNGNYLTNNWVFSRADGTSAAGIINEGNIHAGTGGFVVLAGGAVLNTGNIFAPEGTIHLVAGDEIRIDLGNHAVDVTITEALKEQIDGYQSAIETDGLLDARVIHLQAELMESFYAQTINNEGMIRATTSSNLGRSIRMYSFSEDQLSVLRNGGTLDVSGNELVFNGGTLEMVGDKVLQEGMVNADAYDGGTGGSILITSKEQTVLASGSVTSASGGVGTGDAGEIIIWSDKDTYFENGATIDVSGGDVSGDGGFVEVSGYETVYYEGQAYGGSVDGEAGSILIDPLNIIIVAAGVDAVTGGDAPAAPDEAFVEDPGATMNFDPQAGGAFNGFGDIHLQATNDITVNSAFDTSVATGNPSVSLTLEANNDININAAVSTNNANVTMLADADGNNVGNFNLNAGGSLSSGTANTNITAENVVINGNIDGFDINITGGNDTTINSGTLNAQNAININAGAATANDVIINGGTLNAVVDDITINDSAGTVNDVIINGGTMTAGDNVDINDLVTVANDVVIHGGTMNVTDQIEINEGAGTVSDLIINGGTFTAIDNIDLNDGVTTANDVVINGGTFSTGDDFTINESTTNVNDVVINGGTISAGDDVEINELSGTVNDVIVNGGTITAGLNPAEADAEIEINDGVTNANDVSFNGGTLTSLLTRTVDSLNVNNAATNAGNVNFNGSVITAGQVEINNGAGAVGNIDMNGGVITAVNDTLFSNGTMISSGGQETTVTAGQTLQIDTAFAGGNGNLVLTGNTVNLNNTLNLGTGSISVTSTNDLNLANAITAGNIGLNTAGNITDGNGAANNLTATNQIGLFAGGSIGSGDAIEISADSLVAGVGIGQTGTLTGPVTNTLLPSPEIINTSGFIVGYYEGLLNPSIFSTTFSAGQITINGVPIAVQGLNISAAADSSFLINDVTTGEIIARGTMETLLPTTNGNPSVDPAASDLNVVQETSPLVKPPDLIVESSDGVIRLVEKESE